tara:strand:- start:94 stop:312 length:219 start_codon:yes stop_codon:yes gene_type:complete
MESLDICNVIEIDKIRQILIHHPDLLSMFEILIMIANKRINDEKHCLSMPLEQTEEIPLSDHSSDSDVSDDD